MLALVIDGSRAMPAPRMPSNGHQGVEADDGRQALDHLATAPRSEVALIEWNKPVMDKRSFVAACHADRNYRRRALAIVTSVADRLALLGLTSSASR